jgi:hypothetical protein
MPFKEILIKMSKVCHTNVIPKDLGEKLRRKTVIPCKEATFERPYDQLFLTIWIKR